MNREPMVYSIAGLLFGFVLGYMVSSATHDGPAPTRVVSSPGGMDGMSSAPGPNAASGGAPSTLDPSEVRALSSLAEREKSNILVRVQLGDLLMDHAQPADAIRWYQEALSLDPTLNDTRVDMGACYVRLGKYDEAIAAFDEAIKRDPTHKKASFNKGVALRQSGKPMEAVAVWEGLLKQYPDDPQLAPLRDQITQLRSAGKT
jgi:tetratricopeptide (TPR) repeat protein